MAAYNTDVLPNGDESKGGSNNNLFEKKFEKSVSNDNMANGMGLAREAALKPFENVPGVNATEQQKLRDREYARYSSLVSAGAMGQTQTITNAGIVLDTFGGMFGEGGSKPDIQGGANK